MSFTLYDATIPSMLQIVQAGYGWLDKAEACDLPEEDIVKACLIDDMLPFAYQVKSMAVHSQGAIEGVRAGTFSPDMSDPPQTLAGLKARLVDAEAFLKTVTPDEVATYMDGRTDFRFKDYELRFTSPDFLLSFSQPNFYFHATTAYGILRKLGLDIGKRDFMGQPRLLAG